MKSHSSATQTKEPQYQRCLDLVNEKPPTELGLMTNQIYHDDPRRLGIVLARYKFVAKMFSGMDRVLEVGCADAFGTRVVQQEVRAVTASDFDQVFVDEVNRRMDPRWPFRCVVHDMLSGPLREDFDGVYAIDVLEHIPQEHEQTFVGNITRSLKKTGVCLLGTPSIQSQVYASPPSREGHVNCKDAAGLKSLMREFYENVFIFSMNDEVVHTGFYAMAHYLWALCSYPKPL